tara:strand:+ start:236 stop:397 length:162 start_codon:yes stop_codon:yes gene_type:complete
MTQRNPLKRYCRVCGQQFGNFHQNYVCSKHEWEEHGIPSGEGTFMGKPYKFGP